MANAISPEADTTEGVDSTLSPLDRARLLAPLIESQAQEVNKIGHLTQPVLDAFRENELYWLLVPKAFGGGGRTFVEAIEVLEEVARADGSTGWALMVNVASSGALSGYLPDAGSRDFFDRPDKAITSGVAAPTGTGREVEGGFIVTGKWGFGSASHYATQIGFGFIVVDDEGNPKILENGLPDHRVGHLHRDKLEFLDNWNVTGLKGTGSQDYAATEQFVDEKHCMSVYNQIPVRKEGVYFLGPIVLGVCGHAAIALGLTKRALEEVVKITDGRPRVGYPTPVIDYPVFQFEFVKHEADYQSARAYAMKVYGELEDYAAATGGVTPEMVARARQATTWVHHMARRVITFAHLWSGSQSFREPSILGQISADSNVLTQHLLIDNITLVDAAPEVINSWRRA
jgi:alkylation response protein AidB-like acyl-CoA dehydrogenase